MPNSIVVTRGCPFHCSFCYKDAFFKGGKSSYTQKVDAALSEIDRLPGKHLYFLDDHILGHRKFAAELFAGMQGLGRLFQGAATVDSILRGDLIEKAAQAGLRSLFVGFESANSAGWLQPILSKFLQLEKHNSGEFAASKPKTSGQAFCLRCRMEKI